MMHEEKISSLEVTSTWAVAVVCFVFILISILMEYALHLFTKFFSRARRKSLNQALYKIKADMMLLGSVSLLLTASEDAISKICIPKSAGETFLPCKNKTLPREVLEEPSCQEKEKVSLLSSDGVYQLQMFIFALAFFHVLACVLTFGLGMAKMKRWESWEEETRTPEYQFSNDPRRFKLIHQTSFAKRHLKYWSDHPLLLWPVCFLRQFSWSVSKTDYLTLRHGFIMAHFAEGSKFDFRKFIRRALDNDFQVVVGISLWIWIFSVLFIFFNAHGFYNYFWLPFIPMMMLLLVGTKLQVIITKMCLGSRDEASVVRGTLLVKPKDELFWFSQPQLLLYLLHLILFQNSFQLAFFTWTWYKFGIRSCFHRETEDIVLKIVMALLVQFHCGYVTLPLYALVTQMGSSMKKAVFTEQIIEGLKNWHTTAKRNLTISKSNSTGPSLCPSPSQTIDTSLFHKKEFEMADSKHPSSDIGQPTVEIREQNAVDESKMDNREVYDGEISFGWRNGNMGGQ